MLENPHLHRLFEVFRLDKSETRLAVIREAVAAARARQALDEALLNNLETVLLDPLRRLRAEQFVHQAHSLTRDEELAGCLARLASERGDPLAGLLPALESALLKACAGLLPPFKPQPLADDLPWPPDPGALPIEWEPAEREVLRDA